MLTKREPYLRILLMYLKEGLKVPICYSKKHLYRPMIELKAYAKYLESFSLVFEQEFGPNLALVVDKREIFLF